jgi:hypothetical protein
MPVSFPNPSRSFDARQNRIRFWGYDSTMEISFFVEASAMQKLCPEVTNEEAALLDAFDRVCTRIHEVAEKVYARNRRSNSYTCILHETDF